MIKIWPADKALADCVKAAVDYRCQRCRTVYGEKHRGLHASHYIGRGNWSTRFDPDNVFAHCYGCHRYLESQRPEFEAWVLAHLGDTRYEWLIGRSRDTDIGRQAKREKKEIAQHFLRELSMIQERRKKGEMGDFMIRRYW